MHIARALKFTGQSVWRNIWLASTTVATIILTVLSINLAIALHIGIGQIIDSARDRVNLTLHFYPDVPEDTVNDAVNVAKSIDGVTSVIVVTPDEALADYKVAATNDPDLLKPLEVLDDNPFGYALVVQAASIDTYEQVLQTFEQTQYEGLIESQRKLFEENRRFIAAFSDVAERVQRVSLGISGFFAFITLLLVYNTIRIAIYAHRKEIAIMRLVGATNWFIRAPFLLEVTFYTAVAVVGGIGIFVGVLYASEPHLQSYFGYGVLNLYGKFKADIALFALYQFGALLALALLSSAIAIRRYLRV